MAPELATFAGIGEQRKYLCVIAGPTAAGKTDLAIKIARHYKTEIISADSRQFYREMDIGTARPGTTQLAAAKHHFIGTKSADTLYGAGDFATEAVQLLDDLFRTHKMVVVVGGSGLYIDALLNGFSEFEPVPAAVREDLNAKYKKHGIDWLREQVRAADPRYYSTADLNNPQRLIRALEVCVHTGKPFSEFRERPKTRRNFTAIRILITPPRGELYDRINRRVDDMMSRGWLDEARRLYPLRHNNALRTVGYKELFDFIDGKFILEEATEKIKQHTRNYAKRQLTWFRNRDRYTEFLPAREDEIIQFIETHLRG